MTQESGEERGADGPARGRRVGTNRLTMERIREVTARLGVRPLFETAPAFTEAVEGECANGHMFRSAWSRQRQYGCTLCAQEPYGENLLRSLCHHLHPDAVWKRIFVRGLDPDDPDLQLQFDLACEDLGLYLENTSAYHDGEGPDFFYDGVSKE